jgi:hypothetical protein
MADTALRQLERDVASGNAPEELLWAAQCRTGGHDWQNMIGSFREWLYIHICKRCLATRGRKISQVQLPEFFAVADPKVPERVHVANSVESNSSGGFRAICQRKFKLQGAYHSLKMLKQFVGYLQNCAATPTCKQCLNVLKRSEGQEHGHNTFARRRVAQVYKDLFRPVSFALVEGKVELNENFYQTKSSQDAAVRWLHTDA